MNKQKLIEEFIALYGGEAESVRVLPRPAE